MKILVCLAFAFMPSIALGQAQHKAPASGEETLYQTSNRGRSEVKIFTDDSRPVEFFLQTSWIPGEGHKGAFRYKLTAISGMMSAVDAADPTKRMNLAEYVERMHTCAYFLVVYDNGFVLRKIQVVFQREVDSDGKVIDMIANDSTQMDSSEYKRFLSTKPVEDSWNVNWICNK
jgi:hypothetical protein